MQVEGTVIIRQGRNAPQIDRDIWFVRINADVIVELGTKLLAVCSSSAVAVFSADAIIQQGTVCRGGVDISVRACFEQSAAEIVQKYSVRVVFFHDGDETASRGGIQLKVQHFRGVIKRTTFSPVGSPSVFVGLVEIE